MAELTSTKPYLLRAIFEWCVDNGLTPHLLVAPDASTLVPQAYVKDGEITLSIGHAATKGLQLGNDAVTFAARFGGISQDIYVPMAAVRAIFARENGQGMFFGEPDAPAPDDGGNVPGAGAEPSAARKPALKLVK